MRIQFFLFLVLFLPIGSIFSQEESNLIKLAEQIEGLEEESNDKEIQIKELQDQISILTTQNFSSEKEKEKLRKLIQYKTEEIFSLRNQISDIISEHEKLISKIEFLDLQSKEDSMMVDDLKKSKSILQEKLKKTNNQVRSLTDSLSQIGRYNEVLAAKNKALNEQINEFLEVRKSMSFLEFSYLNPGGFDVSISHGFLTRANTLFFGLDIGYKSYSIDQEDINPSRIELSLLPVVLQVRFPISRRNFAFKYVDPFVLAFENAKYYVFIDFGYTATLSSSINSNYNKGGVTAGAGFGIIFNFFEITNGFIFLGGEAQNFKNTGTPQFNQDDQETIGFFKIGLGVNF